MSDFVSTWLPAIVVLVVALVLGLVLAARAARKPAQKSGHNAELEDLDARKEALLNELRELGSERGKIDAAAYARRRQELEMQAAQTLAARDKLIAQLASARPPRAEKPALTAKPSQLPGFLYGAGTVAVLWVLWSLVVSHGRPEAMSPDGGRPASMSAGAGGGELGELVGRLHKNPDDFEALVQVAHILIRQMRIEQAQPIVERALQINPGHPEARVHSAMVTAAKGDATGALTQLDAVVREHPNEAEAWFFRGMIGMQTGNGQVKNESFTRYLDLAPEGPQKARVRAMLSGEPPPPGDRGAALWARDCATCHGARGRGDGPTGANLALPDMSSAAWQTRVAETQMRKAITQGVVRSEGGRVRSMPAFVLAQDEVEAVIEYVRAFATEAH